VTVEDQPHWWLITTPVLAAAAAAAIVTASTGLATGVAGGGCVALGPASGGHLAWRRLRSRWGFGTGRGGRCDLLDWGEASLLAARACVRR